MEPPHQQQPPPQVTEQQSLSRWKHARSTQLSLALVPVISFVMIFPWLAQFLQHYSINYHSSLSILTMIVIPLFLAIFHFIVTTWCLISRHLSGGGGGGGTGTAASHESSNNSSASKSTRRSKRGFYRLLKISQSQLRRLSECMYVSMLGCCVFIGTHIIRVKTSDNAEHNNLALFAVVMLMGTASVHNMGISDFLLGFFFIVIIVFSLIFLFIVEVSYIHVLQAALVLSKCLVT
jgi:hypothetical protein